MTAMSPVGQPHPRPDFRALLRDVDGARAQLDQLRAGRRQRYLIADGRRHLLVALEAYEAAAASAGFEMPWRLRLELNLYRGLDLDR